MTNQERNEARLESAIELLRCVVMAKEVERKASSHEEDRVAVDETLARLHAAIETLADVAKTFDLPYIAWHRSLKDPT